MSLRLYLDDSADSDEYRLRLAAAGCEVVSPRDVDMVGAEDGAHLAYATRLGLAVLTKDTQDFWGLHRASSAHAGILVIYTENDITRDMTAAEIAQAIGRLERSRLPIAGELHVLNHWRP